MSEEHKFLVGTALSVITILVTLSQNSKSDKDQERSVSISQQIADASKRQARSAEAQYVPRGKVQILRRGTSNLLSLENVGYATIEGGLHVMRIEYVHTGGKWESVKNIAKTQLAAFRAGQSVVIAFEESWLQNWKEEGVQFVKGSITIELQSARATSDLLCYSFVIEPHFSRSGKFSYQVRELETASVPVRALD